MDQFKIILKQVTARKETNMIINENNKNTILQGMVKRGLNQDPNEIREKLMKASKNAQIKAEPPAEPKLSNNVQKNVRDTFNKLRNLK